MKLSEAEKSAVNRARSRAGRSGHAVVETDAKWFRDVGLGAALTYEPEASVLKIAEEIQTELHALDGIASGLDPAAVEALRADRQQRLATICAFMYQLARWQHSWEGIDRKQLNAEVTRLLEEHHARRKA